LKTKLNRIIGLYVGSLLLLIFILLPFTLIIFSSFQYEEALLRTEFDTNKDSFTMSNYKYIFFGIPMESRGGELRSRVISSVRKIPKAFSNSFIVASITALVNFLVCTISSYIFAYKKFRGSKIAYFYVLLSRVIPAAAVVIPFFTIIQKLNLLDTKTSLVFVYSAMTLPITLYFFRVHYEKIPIEVKEAATLEGCSDYTVLRKIIIPMSLPGLMAGTLFAFFLAYSELLFALALTQTYTSKTIPVLLSIIVGSPDLSYSLLCTTLVISATPSIFIGFIVRKYLTKLL